MPQMALIADHNVVETFDGGSSRLRLDVSVLPGRAGRRYDLCDSHRLDPC